MWLAWTTTIITREKAMLSIHTSFEESCGIKLEGEVLTSTVAVSQYRSDYAV